MTLNKPPVGHEVKPTGPLRDRLLSRDVKRFHENDDVDFERNSHHHTIGDGAHQAASGAGLKALKEQVEGLEGGSSGGPEVYYENTPVVTDAGGLNFFGAGVTVVNDGLTNATITIPGSGAAGGPGTPLAYCHAYSNIVLSIPNTGTATQVQFNSDETDPFGMHSTAVNTSRINIPSSGRYSILAGCSFASNATGYRTVWIYVNGNPTAHTRYQAATGQVHLQQTVFEMDLVDNDYVEMYVSQTGSAALNTAAGAYHTCLIVAEKPDSEGGGGSYVHEQNFAVAANTWVINHYQGTKGLDVRTYESGTGVEIIGDIFYPDEDTVEIDFYYPRAGYARVWN